MCDFEVPQVCCFNWPPTGDQGHTAGLPRGWFLPRVYGGIVVGASSRHIAAASGRNFADSPIGAFAATIMLAGCGGSREQVGSPTAYSPFNVQASEKAHPAATRLRLRLPLYRGTIAQCSLHGPYYYAKGRPEHHWSDSATLPVAQTTSGSLALPARYTSFSYGDTTPINTLK